MAGLVSKTEFVYNDVRQKISDGIYDGYSALPTEQKLIRLYGVSRTIVRLSLKKLEEEGIIYRRRGSGTFITKDARERISNADDASPLNVFFVFSSVQKMNYIMFSIIDSFRETMSAGAKARVFFEDMPRFEHYFSNGAGLVFVESSLMDRYPIVPKQYVDRVILINCIHNVYNCICTDNYQGGRLMVRNLIDNGHKRIGLIHYGTAMEYEFNERLRGIYAELADNEIEPAEEIAVDLHNFNKLSPYEASARMLSNISKFTAVITISDFIALALYEVAAQAGIGIPDALSVVSLDDLPFSRYMWPPLTTVRQPVEDIGIKLADVAIKYLKGINVHCSAKVEPKLILRESVKDIS